jgi:hypothetical protein
MTELIGGPWDGRTIQPPEPRPQTILMPLVEPKAQPLSFHRYELQADNQYHYRTEQK